MLWSESSHWNKYHVVHCGIDPAQFQPRTHVGRGKRILFIGRFDPVKGLPLLIEAVEQLAPDYPELQLDLVGDGPLRSEIEAMVREKALQDRVSFHGYLSQARCRDRLREADILVIASFAEGIPVVLMEAMAAGVAVLATNIAGIPELVEHGVSGALVPSGDVGALARGLAALVADPALRTRVTLGGRQRIERDFRTDLEAARLVHVFRERLAGRPVAVRPEIHGVSESNLAEVPATSPVGARP